ncbi:MAG TPA: hypothetical protein VLZ74_16745 [Methylocella sp.]|nr:hypothetical protein [Methylocella sp.]
MGRHSKFALSTVVLALITSTAMAQDAPPTYQADPSVYKVIYEDANYRVIEATWKAGATDKSHSHPANSIAYALTDCSLELKSADGKTANVSPKAGAVTAVVATPSHTAHNVGSADCKSVLIERK